MIPRSSFLGKNRIQPFIYFSIVFFSYIMLHNQRSMLLNFLVFDVLGGISLKSAAFLSKFDVLLTIISLVGLSVNSGGFPRQIIEMFFLLLKSSLLSWQLLVLPTSFTVCHTNSDCLSPTEFLILLIWPWVYSGCSFWCVLVLSGFF